MLQSLKQKERATRVWGKHTMVSSLVIREVKIQHQVILIQLRRAKVIQNILEKEKKKKKLWCKGQNKTFSLRGLNEDSPVSHFTLYAVTLYVVTNIFIYVINYIDYSTYIFRMDYFIFKNIFINRLKYIYKILK